MIQLDSLLQICTEGIAAGKKAAKKSVTSISLTINVDNEESFLLAACCNGVSYTTIKPLHSSQCCREGGREGGVDGWVEGKGGWWRGEVRKARLEKGRKYEERTE